MDIPKIIWRYWEQGWDNAPFVVKKCSESLKKYANDWEVVNLDKNNLYQYIKLPDFFEKEPDFPIQTKSDFIRLVLLQKYGGVWMDATVFLNRNLSDFISEISSEFFGFFRHKNTAMSSWFLASKPNSYIINTWFEHFSKEILSPKFLSENKKYFKSWRGSPNYFTLHRTFEQLTRNVPKFREEINKITFIETFPQEFPALFGLHKNTTNEIISIINSKTPLFKLQHYQKQDSNERSVINCIFKSLEKEKINDTSHTHLSINNRSILIWRSYANNPTYVKDWSGSFVSEDLGVANKKYNRYHIYNFSDRDGQNISQILMPMGDNRLFIRYQIGDKFSSAREVAFVDQIKNDIEYQQEINNLKERIDYLEKALGITKSYSADELKDKKFSLFKLLRYKLASLIMPGKYREYYLQKYYIQKAIKCNDK